MKTTQDKKEFRLPYKIAKRIGNAVKRKTKIYKPEDVRSNLESMFSDSYYNGDMRRVWNDFRHNYTNYEDVIKTTNTDSKQEQNYMVRRVGNRVMELTIEALIEQREPVKKWKFRFLGFKIEIQR